MKPPAQLPSALPPTVTSGDYSQKFATSSCHTARHPVLPVHFWTCEETSQIRRLPSMKGTRVSADFSPKRTKSSSSAPNHVAFAPCLLVRTYDRTRSGRVRTKDASQTARAHNPQPLTPRKSVELENESLLQYPAGIAISTTEAGHLREQENRSTRWVIGHQSPHKNRKGVGTGQSREEQRQWPRKGSKKLGSLQLKKNNKVGRIDESSTSVAWEGKTSAKYGSRSQTGCQSIAAGRESQGTDALLFVPFEVRNTYYHPTPSATHAREAM
ncbi:hypothetical protein FB451DRAFT_1361023 [Mycena latifolia]|nr:hypothetical protein FB451DRAFT_1361023 [Mycena latifolia]